VILGLHQVHRGHPSAGLLALAAEERVEEPVHLAGERLGLHQKSHLRTSIQPFFAVQRALLA
jgi:hypothetical protein